LKEKGVSEKGAPTRLLESLLKPRQISDTPQKDLRKRSPRAGKGLSPHKETKGKNEKKGATKGSSNLWKPTRRGKGVHSGKGTKTGGGISYVFRESGRKNSGENGKDKDCREGEDVNCSPKKKKSPPYRKAHLKRESHKVSIFRKGNRNDSLPLGSERKRTMGKRTLDERNYGKKKGL